MKCALMPMLRCDKVLVIAAVAAVCFVITVSTHPRLPDYGDVGIRVSFTRNVENR